MKLFLLLSLLMSASGVFAANVPPKTSNWMMKVMASGNFAGHEGPGAEYYGVVLCTQSYADPGNHASGTDTCSLSPDKGSSKSKQVTLSKKSSSWFMATMIDSGLFEGHEGPNAEYTGYVRCSQTYADPGNHASAINSCLLSWMPLDSITTKEVDDMCFVYYSHAAGRCNDEAGDNASAFDACLKPAKADLILCCNHNAGSAACANDAK